MTVWTCRAEQLLAYTLLRHSERGTGESYPSQARLAKSCDCTPKQVQRDLAVLIAAGVIEREHRKTRKGNRGNLYRLTPARTHDMQTVEPWEGYADDDEAEVIATINIVVSVAEEGPAQVLWHVRLYERAHADRPEVIRYLRHVQAHTHIASQRRDTHVA